MQSLLSIKPLKTIPDKLFYKVETTITDSMHDKNSETRTYPAFQYTGINTKTGEAGGKMIAAPMLYENPVQYFYPYDKPYRSFYIHYLRSEEKYQGFGTAFINLAKAESRKYNCNRRIHLIASRIYDRENPPHIFYKKQGFICQSKSINKYLDSCIRLNKKISLYMSQNLDMFLPIKETVKKAPSLLTAIFNYLKNIT